MDFIRISRGTSPLVLGLPHAGTYVPERLWQNLNPNGQILADTDWHIHEIYDGLVSNVTTVRTLVHRYVIDVNRDPNGKSLYPGQNTTTLCPTIDFNGDPIWHEPNYPDAAEIARRKHTFYNPYHVALTAELERVRDIYGYVILYDCHSIRSQIPYLFDGILPDFNIGTNDGTSCSAQISDAVMEMCRAAPGYKSILNGRFKGGWTTRHYGCPNKGIHAIQMELAQSTYMVEHSPWDYVPDSAEKMRFHLARILNTLSALEGL